MSQLVVPNVQEIRPTIQTDPLQALLNSIHLVTALTIAVCGLTWFGWRFVAQTLPSNLELLIAIGLAAVPAAVFFLRMAAIAITIDIASSHLVKLFAQTLLVASAVSLPLIYLAYQPDQWLPGESTTNRVLGYAATVGITQVATAYLLLRLWSWDAPLAKHRILAVMVTIGLAYATSSAIAQFLMFAPSPDAFAIRLIFQYGLNLSVAAVLGYLMFEMRRDSAPLLFPVILLAVALLAIGVAISLRSGLSNAQITVTAVNARPFVGLLFSIALSVVGSGACWFLFTQQERSKGLAASSSTEPVVYDFVNTLSFRQRWSHYTLLIFFAIMMILGFILRDRTLNRTVLYQDIETGIRVAYPANWLLDRTGADYVFRVRNMREFGFKTTIQVSVIPIGPDTSERNIADQLAVQRARQLIDYRLLSVTPTTFKGVSADVVTYTFVSRDPSPFLESIPAVVFGEDIIVFSRGQAIVLTFRADVNAYQREYVRFQRFLNSLEL